MTDSGVGTLALLCPRLRRLSLARLPAVRGAFLSPLLRRCSGSLAQLELDALPAFVWPDLPPGALTRALDPNPKHDPYPDPNEAGSGRRAHALPCLRSLRLTGVDRGFIGAGEHRAWLVLGGRGGGGGSGAGAGAGGAAALLAMAPALASLALEGPPSLLAAAARCWCGAQCWHSCGCERRFGGVG